MTFHDVFIGSLEDPDFHWDGGDWNGNIPSMLTPRFPSSWWDFLEVLRRIEEGVYEGKQVDWGAWVAKVDKQQITEFLDERLAASAIHTGMTQSMQDVRTPIEGLESDKLYALVACET